MSTPKFAKLAGAFLAQQEASMPEPPSAEPQENMRARARAISAIEQAILERGRKKRRVRWMIGSAAIAASVLAIVTTTSLLHRASSGANDAPSVSVALAHATGNVTIAAQNGSLSPASDGNAMAAGSRIVAHDGGHAVLALSSGTRIAVDDGGDVAIVQEDATQIFSLASGTMRADVAKLLPGQRFIIRTVDSEVEVHGTSFSVTVVPPDTTATTPESCVSASTRVVVYEGVVSVRHAGSEARVPKGESWPPPCAAASNADPTTVLELPANPDHAATQDLGANAAGSHEPSAPKSAHDKSTTRPHSRSSSPLGDENDIFESGLTAERDGLTNGAISDFERYLSLYPNGPLAEHAAVRRMNLLRTVDHARAAAAAKDYLAKYPNGFARGDAQAIVAEKR